MRVAKLSLSFSILALAIVAISVPMARAISHQQKTSSALAAANSGGAMMQGVGFIQVEGPTLNTRFENALATGRTASGRTPFWNIARNIHFSVSSIYSVGLDGSVDPDPFDPEANG
jgi:hypothetical protein